VFGNRSKLKKLSS